MPGLGDSRPEARPAGEPVALDHRDLLEVSGQDPRGQQARHPGAEHDGVATVTHLSLP